MKKLLFTLLIITQLSLNLTAQEDIKVGLSLDYQTIKEKIPSLVLSFTKDNIKCLAKETGEVWVYYYFNSEDICTNQICLYPISSLKFLIKELNNSPDFVKTGPTSYLYTKDKTIFEYLLVVEDDVAILIMDLI